MILDIENGRYDLDVMDGQEILALIVAIATRNKIPQEMEAQEFHDLIQVFEAAIVAFQGMAKDAGH